MENNQPKEGEHIEYDLICSDCGGQLIPTDDNRLKCQRCLNYYVPLATDPSYGGWTHYDWEELFNR